MLRRMHSLLFLFSGIALLLGGVYLAVLGGTPMYVWLGLLLLYTGYRRWQDQPDAVWIYGGFWVIALCWGVLESGFDGWALLPRLGYFTCLGLGFIERRASGPQTSVARRWWLGGSTLIVCLCLGASIRVPSTVDPVERMGRTTVSAFTATTRDDAGWLAYGHDLGGSRHSLGGTLSVANAGHLQEVWRYSVGRSEAALEATPIAVGETLYLCSGTNDVIALNARDGHELWRYRSGADKAAAILKVCRGVAYAQVSDGEEPCARRVLTNTVDARLIALDASTGKPCKDFGEAGVVSLLQGMGDWAGRHVPGYYYVTSAPTIVSGHVIVGGWVSDAQYWGEPSGVIRAFDVKTGRFLWAFDMGRPHAHGEPQDDEHYTPSTPNAWAPMAADPELGLVYVPTGNTSGSDYYGVRRRDFDEHYASSVVALEVATGEPRWTFQTVHHDLWDYDVAPQPVLVDWRVGDTVRPALLQATKTGEIFVLDRRTGEPLKAVVERPVNTRSAVAQERLSPTQPLSAQMPGFSGPPLTERMMWGLTPFDQLVCRIAFRQARYEGAFTPPGPQTFLQYPGILGGIEWSSLSVDPERGLIFVDASRMANLARLIPRNEAQREGRKPEGFGGQYMHRAQAGTPYAVSNPFFVSPLGVPCQQPPYGTLSAVDLNSGRLVWHRRLGSARASGPWGIPSGLPFALGTPHLGGTFNTGSGVLVTAAGQDHRLRLYESATGRLLGEYPLPAVSVATPMTWVDRDGDQYIIVVAGNHDARLGVQGDTVLAFRTPESPLTEGKPR